MFTVKTLGALDDVPCLWIAAILSPSEKKRERENYILFIKSRI